MPHGTANTTQYERYRATGPIPGSVSEARLLANVTARSTRLLEDGYRARRRETQRLAMHSPSGATYELDAKAHTCTCPFFVKHEGRYDCKHLLGASCLLQKQAEIQRHNQAMWEALI